MGADDPFAVCEETVRRHDEDRYFAALFAPESGRRHLFVLYALYYELAHVLSAAREPMISDIRFAWWRETVESARQGRPREHAVARALVETLASADLPQDLFDKMIEGWGLARGPFETESAAAENAVSRIGALMDLSVRILGGAGEFQDAAIAYGLAGQHDSLAKAHFAAARKQHYSKALLPVVMPAALTPLYLKHPKPPLWRKQLVYLRVSVTGRL